MERSKLLVSRCTEGVWCERCKGCGVIVIGDGGPDSPFELIDCPICITGGEEPRAILDHPHNDEEL